MSDAFINCLLGLKPNATADEIKAEMKKSKFGEKRIKGVLDSYNYRVAEAQRIGDPNPGVYAMTRTINEMVNDRNMKILNFEARVQLVNRVKERLNVADKITLIPFRTGIDVGKGAGGRIAAGARSLLERDPRIAGVDVHSAQEVFRSKYIALAGDMFQKFYKNTWGNRTDIPSASMGNIVRELYKPGSTGDVYAKEIAESYLRVQKITIADLKRVGAMVHTLADYHLPQWQSIVRMQKAGMVKWVKDHMSWVDWDKTVRADGSVIPVDQREETLQAIYNTMTTRNVKDLPDTGHFQGKAMGNMLEQERFLHYKDADAWLAMNEAYMDGTVADTLVRHIDRRAQQIGTMSVLGPNPAEGIRTIQAMSQKAAERVQKTGKGIDAHALREYDAGSARVQVMADNILHKHPEDANMLANTVNVTSNLATAALLKSAVFISMASDMLNTMAYRFATNQSVTGFMGQYLAAMFPGGAKKQAHLLAASGFAAHELWGNNYIASRWGMAAQYGRGYASKFSQAAMRLTLLQRHTLAMRGAAQHEIMGALWRERHLKLNDTYQTKALLKMSGLTADEWDHVRHEVPAWEPHAGVQLLRPMDILNMNYASKHTVWQKLQSAVFDQSALMIPNTSAETTAVLKRGLRSDNLPGALLHSAAMYHGYPVTMAMSIGRLIAGGPDMGVNRIKLSAALGVAGIMAGAVGVYMRDLVAGKNPEPVTDPNFWYRSVFASFALPIWGDLVTGGLSDDPTRGIGGVVLGPLGTEMAALTGIALTPAGWLDIGDRNTPVHAMMRKSVDFVGRYIMPATFFSYIPVQRAIFDNLDRLVDPEGTRRSNRASVALQKKRYNRDFWSAPGSGVLVPGMGQ